jgi:hypothetical protein
MDFARNGRTIQKIYGIKGGAMEMTTKECLNVLKCMLEIRKGEVNSGVNALSHAISVLERIDEIKINKVIWSICRGDNWACDSWGCADLAKAIVKELEGE